MFSLLAYPCSAIGTVSLSVLMMVGQQATWPFGSAVSVEVYTSRSAAARKSANLSGMSESKSHLLLRSRIALDLSPSSYDGPGWASKQLMRELPSGLKAIHKCRAAHESI